MDDEEKIILAMLFVTVIFLGYKLFELERKTTQQQTYVLAKIETNQATVRKTLGEHNILIE